MAEVAFRYGVIADDAARGRARTYAVEIRLLTASDGEAVVGIGQRLAAVRECLPALQFHAWVKAEFGWDRPAACNYMQAAKVFGRAHALDRFRPAGMFVLARRNVPRRVVEQALRIAGDGVAVTLSLARRLLAEAGVGPAQSSAGRHRSPSRSLAAVLAAVRQVHSVADLLQSLELLIADVRPLFASYPAAKRASICEWCLLMSSRVRSADGSDWPRFRPK